MKWLAIRTTRKIRQALKDAARPTGRSLAQEIEWRLIASLRPETSRDDPMMEAFQPMPVSAVTMTASVTCLDPSPNYRTPPRNPRRRR